jgi:hypothetical protein
MDVADEFHFLVNCDKLIHERVTLFRNISDIVPSFTTMSDVEKFMLLLIFKLQLLTRIFIKFERLFLSTSA